MELEDPLSVISDLKNKRVKCIKEPHKTFDDSFERFIRLGKLKVNGLTIENDIIEYARQYFHSTNFKDKNIYNKSISYQIDKVFQCKNSGKIIEALHELKVTACFYPEDPHSVEEFAIIDKKYAKLINVLNVLEKFLYSVEFENVAKTRIADQNSYKFICANIKKALAVYILIGPQCYQLVKYKKITYIFWFKDLNDKLIKAFLIFNKGYQKIKLSTLFDANSPYGLLGLVPIALDISQRENITNEEVVDIAIKRMESAYDSDNNHKTLHLKKIDFQYYPFEY